MYRRGIYLSLAVIGVLPFAVLLMFLLSDQSAGVRLEIAPFIVLSGALTGWSGYRYLRHIFGPDIYPEVLHGLVHSGTVLERNDVKFTVRPSAAVIKPGGILDLYVLLENACDKPRELYLLWEVNKSFGFSGNKHFLVNGSGAVEMSDGEVGILTAHIQAAPDTPAGNYVVNLSTGSPVKFLTFMPSSLGRRTRIKTGRSSVSYGPIQSLLLVALALTPIPISAIIGKPKNRVARFSVRQDSGFEVEGSTISSKMEPEYRTLWMPGQGPDGQSAVAAVWAAVNETAGHEIIW